MGDDGGDSLLLAGVGDGASAEAQVRRGTDEVVVAAAGRLRGAVAGNADVQRHDQALQGREEGGGEADYRRGAAEFHCVERLMKELNE